MGGTGDHPLIFLAAALLRHTKSDIWQMRKPFQMQWMARGVGRSWGCRKDRSVRGKTAQQAQASKQRDTFSIGQGVFKAEQGRAVGMSWGRIGSVSVSNKSG